jgi:hypothetical protein
MHIKSVLATVAVLCLVSAASGWEYTATFDTDEDWKYFDNDIGPGTDVASGGGVLSVPAPSYGAWSWRYVFFDKDSTGFASGDQDLAGGYVQTTLSYTGVAPTFAYFFLAGGGEGDLIYIDGSVDGSQTFWGSFSDPLVLSESPDTTTTAKIYFTPDNFGVFNVGTVHDARRGSADSWATTIASVDAVGIALGYFGDASGATVEIDEFTVTPEPSLLLLSGPLAGFLGWKIRRKTRKAAAKA